MPLEEVPMRGAHAAPISETVTAETGHEESVSLSRRRGDCRLCHSTDLDQCVPLPPLPVASPNVGSKATVDEMVPADVYRCLSCGALQLLTMVDPAFQYRSFRYTTAISVGLREHFEGLMHQLSTRGDLAKNAFVFDIGSNDGSVLRLAAR